MRVVDDVYKTREEIQSKIAAFAKEYAPKGEQRLALKDYKNNMHALTDSALREGGVTYLEMAAAKPFDLAILKGKL